MSSNAILPAIQSKWTIAGHYAVLLLILTLPFSTAIAQISTALIAILWLVSGQYKTLPNILLNNPAYLFAFLLFIWLFFGISYSSVPFESAFPIFAKYRKLLLLIIIIPFVVETRFRQRALLAFVTASTITLIGSYAIHFDLIPSPSQTHESPTFKSSITHSVFIGFFAFYCLHRMADGHRYLVVWCGLFLLSVHNLFFLVPGRSGQLLFILLIWLFSLQRFNFRGTLLSLLLTTLFISLFFLYSEQAKRFIDGALNSYAFFQNNEQLLPTSMGYRLTFWKYALSLLAERPWFGFGTGGYAREYTSLAPQTGFILENAHNEYLMIAIQLGVTGLILFLFFLIALYRHSLKLAEPTRWLAQGVLLALAINSLFNSSLLDHPEGHWFVLLIALFFTPQRYPDTALTT